jgi:hypothetical protein
MVLVVTVLKVYAMSWLLFLFGACIAEKKEYMKEANANLTVVEKATQ